MVTAPRCLCLAYCPALPRYLSITTLSPTVSVETRICWTYARNALAFIAPSRTIGTVIPKSLSAPINVVVFQCPCGIAARQRSPQAARSFKSCPALCPAVAGQAGLAGSVMSAQRCILQALSITSRCPREWIDALSIDDALRLAAAVFEVNADFFIERLAPTLQALAPRMAARWAGQTPSPD